MKKLLVTLTTLFPLVANAHEDHGHSVLENLSHVLSNPEHAWPLSLGLVLVVVAVVAYNKK
jgi:hypothetical protein